MDQRPELNSIPQAAEELREIPALYARYKGESHEVRTSAYKAVVDAFERVRVYLDREDAKAPKDWEAEAELKAAYNRALETLEQSFDSHIAAIRVKMKRDKEQSLWGRKK